MNEHYQKEYERSIKDRTSYFDELAKDVSWFKPYTKVKSFPIIS